MGESSLRNDTLREGVEVLSNAPYAAGSLAYRYYQLLLLSMQPFVKEDKVRIQSNQRREFASFNDHEWFNQLTDLIIKGAPNWRSRLWRWCILHLNFDLERRLFSLCLMDDIVAVLCFEQKLIDVYNSSVTIAKRAANHSNAPTSLIKQAKRAAKQADFAVKTKKDLIDHHLNYYLRFLTAQDPDEALRQKFNLANVVNAQGYLYRAMQIRLDLGGRLKRSQTADVAPLQNYIDRFWRQYSSL